MSLHVAPSTEYGGHLGFTGRREEKQIEKTMDHEMEAGVIFRFKRISSNIGLLDSLYSQSIVCLR